MKVSIWNSSSRLWIAIFTAASVVFVAAAASSAADNDGFALFNHPSQRTLQTGNESVSMSANETAEDELDCHCHDHEAHCTNQEDVALFSCDDEEEHVHDHVEEEHVDELDCHCHDHEAHCTNPEDEALFSCDDDDVEEHAHDDELDCHCHDHEAHCTNPEHESLFSCEDDGHDHEGDCHCDGDVPHCTDPADEESYVCETDPCHCDGSVPHCEEGYDESKWACPGSGWVPNCNCEGATIFCEEGIGDDQCECNSAGYVSCVGFTEQELISSNDKPWGAVIVTSLVVNLTTLAGVVVVGIMWLVKRFFPNCDVNKQTAVLWVEVLIPMFACGALMATTVFILFPESYLMVLGGFMEIDPHAGHDHRRMLAGDDFETHPNAEGAANWRWGSSIMGGFWIPVIMHGFFPHDHDHGHGHDHGHDHGGHADHNGHDHSHNHEGTKDDDEIKRESAVDIDQNSDISLTERNVTDTDKNVIASALAKSSIHSNRDIFSHENDDEDEYVKCCGCIRMKNLPLFVSMNIGEALHNFTDGIFLGTAWLACGSAMAISIAVATILHELPNQLAGFFVMVNQNGLNPFVALGLNFLFGLSIMLGGLIVLAFEFDDVTVGCILAIGGGTFLHVSIGELLPNAERNMTRGIQMLWSFFAFLVGAIPIGLILINHEHC